MKNNKWFTMFELLIVITILIILSTIWIVNYSGNLTESRNAKRISDLSTLSVALKEDKISRGYYVYPKNSVEISNWVWNIVVYKWELNSDVPLSKVDKFPKDPLVKNKNYVFSVTKNRNKFELSTIIENGNVVWNELWYSSYITWDYKTSNITILPSITFATDLNLDIAVDNSKFIFNKLELNLPYDWEWKAFSQATSLSQILNENIDISKFYWYFSCEEIFTNWSFYGTWYYQILDNDSINGNVNCAVCNGANQVWGVISFDWKQCIAWS